MLSFNMHRRYIGYQLALIFYLLAGEDSNDCYAIYQTLADVC